MSRSMTISPLAGNGCKRRVMVTRQAFLLTAVLTICLTTMTSVDVAAFARYQKDVESTCATKHLELRALKTQILSLERQIEVSKPVISFLWDTVKAHVLAYKKSKDPDLKEIVKDTLNILETVKGRSTKAKAEIKSIYKQIGERNSYINKNCGSYKILLNTQRYGR